MREELISHNSSRFAKPESKIAILIKKFKAAIKRIFAKKVKQDVWQGYRDDLLAL